tara:strand:- start:53 stop:922 length:870 start_codon:yes stop_codon:yes gene_type:complete
MTRARDISNVITDANLGGTLDATGIVTANAGVKVDNITIDGTEIDLSSGDLTVDVEGDITLDANGGDIKLSDNGTVFGELTNSSSYLRIKNPIQDQDIEFVGNDGGVNVTALALDMSVGGMATIANGLVLTDGNIVVADGHGIDFGNASGSASGSLASLLDDYEEGTWTPTVSSGTIGVVSGSARYVKIGNLVTCYARILSFSDQTSGTGFHLQSLPFTVNSAHTDANVGNAWGNAMGNHRSLFFFSQTNSTQTLGYYGAAGNNSYNQTIHSDFVAETNMILKLTYMTA